MPKLELVSHALCPYVQRAAIALAEKNVPFTRTVVDLAKKPEWFKAISPLVRFRSFGWTTPSCSSQQ
jgi:glutathione S-transferase